MARKGILMTNPRERIVYELSRIIAMRDASAAKVKMDALRAYARIHGLGQILGEPPNGGTSNQPGPPIAENPGQAEVKELSFEEQMKARLGSDEKKED